MKKTKKLPIEITRKGRVSINTEHAVLLYRSKKVILCDIDIKSKNAETGGICYDRGYGPEIFLDCGEYTTNMDKRYACGYTAIYFPTLVGWTIRGFQISGYTVQLTFISQEIER